MRGRTGIAKMRSQPSSVLDGASPAEVFHGGRKPRSAILPHFNPVKKIDCDRIAAFRSVIHENQAARMKSKNLTSEPLQVGQSVRIQKQEKSYTWSEVGQVSSVRDHGKSSPMTATPRSFVTAGTSSRRSPVHMSFRTHSG